MSDHNELRAESTHFEMIPHWVMDHPEISSSGIRLYLILRRYADKQGRSFPSRSRLARDMNTSALKTVDAAIDNLVSIGALEVESRFSEDGDRTSNLYTIKFGGLGKNYPTVGQNLPNGGVEMTIGTNTQLTTYPTNQDINTSLASTDRFEEFWDAYPRKIGKGAAKKAWCKITTDPDTVIAAAFVFAGARQNEDPKFTPHAATWLNAGRWDDEPDPQGFRTKSSTQDSWEALQRGAQYLDEGKRAF